MEPRLVVVSGTNKGTVARLNQDEMIIGRDATNGLFLSEEAVSRKHCAIQSKDGVYRIIDLNSRNGTFVNGIPVREKILQHGNTIRLGYTVLVFLVEEDEAQTPSNQLAESEDEPALPPAGRTMVLSPADRRLALGAELPDLGTMVRDLHAFLKISSRINAIYKTDLLQREFLELMFEVTPAAHGSIVLTSGLEDAGTVTSLRRNGGKGGSEEVNWKLVNRVMWEHASLVNEPELAGAGNGGSVLCVPLSAMKKNLGVIHLVTAPRVSFEENHLNLVNALAGIFAVALENALHLESLEGENSPLRNELELEHSLIGESGAMSKITQFVARVAPSDSTVLIRGESGTGKEVVARAIHRNSRRKDNPFVAINCAAIAETLLESDLFGHERGAFTGATAMKKGRLEVANTGTLFLDEIGEMAPALQAKLLRVLQNREFERVGGTRAMKVDVRFLAATNRNLEEAMKIGAFRPDLFYRLNVVSVGLPPLREHREDIPLLAMYFAAEYSAKCKRPLKGISPEARALLMRYGWPGNVRELENAIERAVVLGVSNTIVPEDLPEALLEAEADADAGSKYQKSINALKKQLIVDAVERSRGMITEAAKLLGVHPNYLHRLIRNLNIRGLIARDAQKNPISAA
jgi:transcriptional regulator with GAF, ATPase, and Fis domain/pSer/pThr/pTyr-binding forkhead associated (FHA) protein